MQKSSNPLKSGSANSGIVHLPAGDTFAQNKLPISGWNRKSGAWPVCHAPPIQPVLYFISTNTAFSSRKISQFTIA